MTCMYSRSEWGLVQVSWGTRFGHTRLAMFTNFLRCVVTSGSSVFAIGRNVYVYISIHIWNAKVKMPEGIMRRSLTGCATNLTGAQLADARLAALA